MSGGLRPSASLPPHLRALLPGALLVLVLLTAWYYGRDVRAPVVSVQGRALGTTWSVKLAAAPGAELGAEDETRAIGIARERLAEVDRLMSTWRDDSELMGWNAARTTEPLPLSEPTLAVFSVALDVHRASGGAFDVTVGPLVDAWGFGRSGEGERAEPPADAELAALRERLGSDRLALDLEAGTLAKGIPSLEADLSAVAKGYAVDHVALGLVEAGYSRFLVEVGGELRAAGEKPDGTPWRVAIETPTETASDGRSIHRVLPLRDLSMATSGDYRNYYEGPDGRRLSHTIDPRSGRPIEHRLASVTVLHPEAAVADAWATALNVLGPDAGYALAEARGLVAYLLVRRSGGSEAGSEPGFEGLETTAFRASFPAPE